MPSKLLHRSSRNASRLTTVAAWGACFAFVFGPLACRSSERASHRSGVAAQVTPGVELLPDGALRVGSVSIVARFNGGGTSLVETASPRVQFTLKVGQLVSATYDSADPVASGNALRDAITDAAAFNYFLMESVGLPGTPSTIWALNPVCDVACYTKSVTVSPGATSGTYAIVITIGTNAIDQFTTTIGTPLTVSAQAFDSSYLVTIEGVTYSLGLTMMTALTTPGATAAPNAPVSVTVSPSLTIAPAVVPVASQAALLAQIGEVKVYAEKAAPTPGQRLVMTLTPAFQGETLVPMASFSLETLPEAQEFLKVVTNLGTQQSALPIVQLDANAGAGTGTGGSGTSPGEDDAPPADCAICPDPSGSSCGLPGGDLPPDDNGTTPPPPPPPVPEPTPPTGTSALTSTTTTGSTSTVITTSTSTTGSTSTVITSSTATMASTSTLITPSTTTTASTSTATTPATSTMITTSTTTSAGTSTGATAMCQAGWTPMTCTESCPLSSCAPSSQPGTCCWQGN